MMNYVTNNNTKQLKWAIYTSGLIIFFTTWFKQTQIESD